MKLTTRSRLLTMGLAGILAVGVVGAAGIALAQDPGDSGTPAPQADGGPGGRHGARHLFKVGMHELITASGLSEDVVKQGLKDGKSLNEIFAANNVNSQVVISKALVDLKTKLDEAVKNNKLTQDQANTIQQKAQEALPKLLDAKPGDHKPGDGKRGGPGEGQPGAPGERHGGPGHGPGLMPALDVAAKTIGITDAQLIDELKQGKTIAQVATAHNSSAQAVIDAMVAAASQRIDQAVTDGKIDAARAAEMKTKLKDMITKLVNEGAPKRGPRAQ